MPVLKYKPLPEQKEELSFFTNVLRSFSTETRVKLRPPRTRVTYRFVLSDAQYADFEETLRDNLQADWTVPLWYEATRGFSASSGATSLTCNTDADYRVGSEVLIWKGCEEYETAALSAVGSGSVTASGAIGATYSNAAIMPAHDGYMAAPAQISRTVKGWVSVGLTFELRASPDLSATGWASYDGYEVLGCSSAVLSNLAGLIAVPVEYVDSGVGPVALVQKRSTPDVAFEVAMADTVDRFKRKQFLHQIAGKKFAFWVRSWGGKIPLAVSVGASDTTISVTPTKPISDYIGRHIEIDGLYREITNAVDAGATYTLTIDNPPGQAITATAYCTFLSLVRSNADNFEIAHHPGLVSSVNIPVIEVAA